MSSRRGELGAENKQAGARRVREVETRRGEESVGVLAREEKPFFRPPPSSHSSEAARAESEGATRGGVR